MSFLIWLEETAVSEWIRGSPSIFAFPFILYLHTLGLAMIAGLSTAVALSLIVLPGSAKQSSLVRLFPVMWAGLGINVLSGLALLIAYPAKALTNPVFYIKLIAIAAAVAIVQWLQRQFETKAAATSGSAAALASPAAQPALRRAAWALIALWLIATLTGRLLAYTHSMLMASMPGII